MLVLILAKKNGTVNAKLWVRSYVVLLSIFSLNHYNSPPLCRLQSRS